MKSLKKISSKFLNEIKKHNQSELKKEGTDKGFLYLNESPEFWEKHGILTKEDWYKRILAYKQDGIPCTCKKNPDKCKAFHPWLVYEEWKEKGTNSSK